MSAATPIIDHDAIRRWAKARGGRPSRVRNAGRDGGFPRFDFDGEDAALEEISWDMFFEIFDESELALLEQEQTATGKTSRFFRFIHRGLA